MVNSAIKSKGEIDKSSSSEENRKKALGVAVETIEKQYGKGSIMRLGENKILAVEAIPTGSISLDIALGVGGVPRGRIVEIYGPESSGKTTLALHIIREAQKNKGICAFVDAEHAFDPDYAEKIGVKSDSLLISQPDTGEQALEITETLVRSNAIDVIVIDSVSALVPRSEIEGNMGDMVIGGQARLMSQALRKLTGAISRSKAVVIFINQIRMKIGVMFGNPETTSGGNALKFYSSVRIDVRRRAPIKVGEDIIGNRVGVKIVKNKVAPPFKSTEFDLLYSEGISYEGDLLDVAVNLGAISKNGAWYLMENHNQNGEEKEGEVLRLGQGKEAARQFLKDNSKITKIIEQKIYKFTKIKSKSANK